MIRIMTTKNKFLSNRSILKTLWKSQVITRQFVLDKNSLKRCFIFVEARATTYFCQDFKWGRYKRAYIAALQQAKIYPPRQAAAAVDRALRLLQCMSRCNAGDGMWFILCIAVARALRQLQ